MLIIIGRYLIIIVYTSEMPPCSTRQSYSSIRGLRKGLPGKC